MTTTIGALHIRGVALIVSNPHREILIVKELQTKPHYGKYAGMFSPPMETSHDGERDSSALGRLVAEELPGLTGHIEIDGERRGVYRIVPRVWVSLYIGQTQDFLLPIPDKKSGEIGEHLWVPPQNVLMLWLRQGAREMILDYIEDRSGVVCRYCYPATSPEV